MPQFRRPQYRLGEAVSGGCVRVNGFGQLDADPLSLEQGAEVGHAIGREVLELGHDAEVAMKEVLRSFQLFRSLSLFSVHRYSLLRGGGCSIVTPLRSAAQRHPSRIG